MRETVPQIGWVSQVYVCLLARSWSLHFRSYSERNTVKTHLLIIVLMFLYSLHFVRKGLLILLQPSASCCQHLPFILFSHKILSLKIYAPLPLNVLLFLTLTSGSLSPLPGLCHGNSPMKIHWELLRVSSVLKYSFFIIINIILYAQLWGFFFFFLPQIIWDNCWHLFSLAF